MPGDPSCVKCGGRGIILKDELNSQRCACNTKIQIRDRLGYEMSQIPTIEGALFDVGDLWDKPKKDRTKDNLFFQGRWSTILSHFKWAFTCKLIATQLQFHYIIITDERIKNVYVGNEHFRAKSREDSEREESHNGLPDIMLGPDLVIVRLGFLGHRNRAAGGGLREALMLREVDQKPTWIVDNIDRPYDVNHLSYDPDTSAYIDSHFQVVDFRSESASVQASQPSPVRSVPAPFQAEDVAMETARPSVDDDTPLILYDPIVTEGSKKFKPKKRGKGLGPV